MRSNRRPALLPLSKPAVVPLIITGIVIRGSFTIEFDEPFGYQWAMTKLALSATLPCPSVCERTSSFQ